MTRPNDVGPSLLCRVATQWCALPIADVREIMRPLPLEPCRGAPPFVLGIAAIRGIPTPVVDLAQLVGATATTPERFVVVRAGDHALALATGAVTGVREIAAVTLAELPPLLRDVAYVAALGTLDADLLVVLQTARLVPDALWERLTIAEASA